MSTIFINVFKKKVSINEKSLRLALKLKDQYFPDAVPRRIPCLDGPIHAYLLLRSLGFFFIISPSIVPYKLLFLPYINKNKNISRTMHYIIISII